VRKTAIGLDAARNPIALSRNGTVIESMEYDQQHRLKLRHSVTSSGTTDTHYTYDPGSGLLTRTDSSNGTSKVFTYDAGGNVTSAVLDDGLHKYGTPPPAIWPHIRLPGATLHSHPVLTD